MTTHQLRWPHNLEDLSSPLQLCPDQHNFKQPGAQIGLGPLEDSRYDAYPFSTEWQKLDSPAWSTFDDVTYKLL